MSAAHNDVALLSNLADQYREKVKANPRKYWGDILKAHTLYNACTSRSSAKKWREKAFAVQKTYWGDNVSSTLKEQTEIARDFQAQLYTIRDECRDDLSPVTDLINRWDCTTDNLDSAENGEITRQLCRGMKSLSLAANAKMKVFAGKVMQQSVELCLKRTPCKFAAVALGSMAKGEATPYSDLEFMFLLEKKTPEIVEYFETLAMTVYFLIGNLQETKLKYMNIAELKAFKDKGKNGFKIDGLQTKAGNIPTGNGTEEQKNKFILTVDELLDKYQQILLNPDPEDSKKGDFTSMLAHTTVIYAYGEQSLLSEFETRRQLVEVNKARMNAHNTMIKQDVEDYDFMPLSGLTLYNHRANLKSAIYRFPSLLTYNMKIIYNIESKTSWETLDKLQQMKKLSKSFYASLQFLLASALYIRLAAYLHHDSQNDDMIFLPSWNPSSKSAYWHLPKKLHVHMSLHMIPVKVTIAKSNNPLHVVKTEIIYDTNVVSAHTYFHAGNHAEALKLLKNLNVKGLEELTMLAQCYMSLQRWSEYQSAVHRIIDYTKLSTPLNVIRLRYWKYKSATGYAQAKDLASAKKGFEDVLSDLPPHLYFNHEIYAHASNFYLRICDDTKSKYYYEKACIHLEETAPSPSYYASFKSQMLHNRAARFIDNARYAEAEPLLLQSLSVLKDMHGEHGISENLANGYHALGNVYAGLRQNTEALEYQRKAEELYNFINPMLKDVNMSTQCISFALTYEIQGNLEKALEYYHQALAQTKQYHPHKHPSVADLERRVGYILIQQGKYDEAERHYKESLAIYTSLDDVIYNNQLARCRIEYGNLCLLQDRHAESLEHLYKVVNVRYNRDDITEMDVVCEAWSSIGKSLVIQGKHEEAVKSFEKSVSNRHSRSQMAAVVHAMNYCHLGQSYLQSSKLKQTTDKLVAHSKAHQAFVNAILLLTSRPSRETDYSIFLLGIAAHMFKNWRIWLYVCK